MAITDAVAPHSALRHGNTGSLHGAVPARRASSPYRSNRPSGVSPLATGEAPAGPRPVRQSVDGQIPVRIFAVFITASFHSPASSSSRRSSPFLFISRRGLPSAISHNGMIPPKIKTRTALHVINAGLILTGDALACRRPRQQLRVITQLNDVHGSADASSHVHRCRSVPYAPRLAIGHASPHGIEHAAVMPSFAVEAIRIAPA